MSILNQLLIERERSKQAGGPAPVNANYNSDVAEAAVNANYYSGEAEAAVNVNNNVNLFGLPSPCQCQ